jgi:hypothetical protein
MPGSKSSAGSRTSKRKAKKSKRGALPSLWLVVPVLLTLSVAAIAWFWSHGYLLYWGDANAHLSIARRIIDSRTPGYEQIGTVWLPLPHVLMLPLVSVDGLWRSGLAASAVMGVCFVWAGCMLFSAVERLWDSQTAAWTALLLFALNPNVLYLQSIAMTEALFFACTMTVLYALVRPTWWLAGIGLLGATLTRYEGWFLIPGVVAFFFFREGWRAAVGVGAVASLGPVYWMGHNAILFSDWLEFYRGRGSAIDIQGAGDYPGRGDWLKAAQYFAAAGQLVSGWGLVAVGAAGTVVALVRRQWWLVLFLALAPVFYVISLHGSSTPIYVPHLWPHSYYNTRYGMALIPLLAFGGAALVSVWPRGWLAGLVVSAAVLPWVFYPKADGWVTWKESQVNSETRRAWTAEASSYLAANYERGTGVVCPFGDYTAILREAGIPLRETVHEDNGLYFEAIVKRPDLFLWQEWVVARGGDRMSESMSKYPRYERVKIIDVKNSAPLEIYRRKRR